MWWDDHDRPLCLSEHERGPWNRSQVGRALARVQDGALVIGKSVASCGSPVIAGLALPCVW